MLARVALEAFPLFTLLPEAERAALLAAAQKRTFSTGAELFYAGDPPRELMALLRGEVALGIGRATPVIARAGTLLDEVAVLGGLPHHMNATANEDGECLVWQLEDLWRSPDFTQAVRRYLAEGLARAQTRLNELEAPVHYRAPSAQLNPGPFRFDEVLLIFAFCEADHEALVALLPPQLRLFQRPGRQKGAVLLALADFPNSYPEGNPAARFFYNETTVFVPVRYKSEWGLYVPYIYPSAYEPILLGREIYGFPKRLGQTHFESNAAWLTVNGDILCRLDWHSSAGVSESRLVQSFGDMLGINGQLIGLAFQAGEVLRRAARLPAHRRVDVYNHRRILAADATPDRMGYAVNELTRATFGVLNWEQIARLEEARLAVDGAPLNALNLKLRDAYRTRLYMRLSTGRTIADYRKEEFIKVKK